MGHNKGMTWKHLTRISKRKIKKMWKSGIRQIDIAKEFGIAQSGVSRICKEEQKKRKNYASN